MTLYLEDIREINGLITRIHEAKKLKLTLTEVKSMKAELKYCYDVDPYPKPLEPLDAA